MDTFDLKKYLAEGRLLKEEQMGSYTKFLKVVKSYEDEEILKDFLDSYPKGQDISKSEYDKFTEKHFGLADPEDYRDKNWKYITSEGRLFEEEGQWFDPSSPSHGKGYKMLGDTPQEGAFYVSGYDSEKDEDIEGYVLDPNYDKYMPATQELLDLADEQGHEYKSVEEYYEYVEGFQNDLRDYAKGGKFEGEEIPNWLMKDLATAFGTDYSQFYSDGEDDEDEDYED